MPAHARDGARVRDGAAPSVDDLHVAEPATTLDRHLGMRRVRGWVVETIALDITMLIVANVLTLATDSGRSVLLPLLLVFDAVALGVLLTRRGYEPRRRLDMLEDARLGIGSTAIAAMVTISAGALVVPERFSAYDLVRLWVFSSLAVAVGRVALTRFLLSGRRSGELGAATIIVGAGLVGRLTARRLLDHPEVGLRPIGFLDKDPLEMRRTPLPVPMLGSSWNLGEIVSAHHVDCVVITFSSAPHDVLLELLDECDRLGIRSLVVPRLFERVPSRLHVTHVGGLPLLETLPANPKSLQYTVKYVVDRLLGSVLLLLLAPLLFVIALAVLISLGRPILYRQDRVGLDGRRFVLFKFRTMRQPPESVSRALDFRPENAPGGVEGDDRRTRIGCFLRRTSLDELPQLLNVVKGEMSLVGPRPERPEYVEYFGENVRRYDARHRVKSGITGWAQIHRLRGQTSISDRVEWDNYYIENFSLWLDLKILVLTIPEVLRGEAE